MEKTIDRFSDSDDTEVAPTPDVREAARSLLSLTVDDLEPFRDDFTLYTTLSLGEMAIGIGLSRSEVETALSSNHSTTYRRLKKGAISPFITCKPIQRRDRYHDKRNHIYQLTRPSENEALSLDEYEEIWQLEVTIVTILTSRRQFGRFIREIGRGLEDPVTIDRVLDNLAWLNSIIYDSYIGLLSLPDFELRAANNLPNILQILYFMDWFFGKGHEGFWGRALLSAYAAYWQGKTRSEPEFDGTKHIGYLYDSMSKPFIPHDPKE